ncbi:MAG: ATP phosphoribosyltransferase [Armatimonadota bacterium]
MTDDKVLRIGLPKGSLQDATIEMFKKAGWNIKVDERQYKPDLNDDELWSVLLRAQEMPTYVANGVLDCGLTGLDWIKESGVEDSVVEVADLVYAKRGMTPYRWVLAVHENSDIEDWEDLQGGRIATELVNVTRGILEDKGIDADVEYSWGATEAKCPSLVDAIIEGTETGSTLEANNLRIIKVLFESTTKLIANKEAWEDDFKRRKIKNIALMLEAALSAEHYVGLKMNCSDDDLDAVLDVLPALKNPTISELANNGWHAIEVIVRTDTVRHLVPRLKAAGAQGIIEYPLNKVIL